MIMANKATVAILPVGEFESDTAQEGFEGLVEAFDRARADLLVLPAVSNEDEARESIQELSPKDPILLAIIVSRGLSAQAIEATARASRLPGLVLPLQGNYALPSSTLAVGACREDDLPVELLYGTPDEAGFIDKLNHTVSAASAYARIKNARIGVIGSLFPNLVACRYDPEMIQKRLGATLVPIPFESVRQARQGFAGENQPLTQYREKIAKAYQVDAADSTALTRGLQLHLALKRLAAEQRLDGFATECWSGCPGELGLNPCLGFIEDEYELACEGDVMLCLSLLMVQGLTGSRAFAGDLYDLDREGILTLIHCGAPASLSTDQAEVVLGNSQLALARGFETITCRPRLAPGPVTLFRFYGKECDKMHLARGSLIDCEQQPNLTIKVRIEGDRSAFLDQCLGNHYVMAAGDHRSELKLLAKWLGITVFET
jgi:L-fucose isomerase-like protein